MALLYNLFLKTASPAADCFDIPIWQGSGTGLAGIAAAMALRMPTVLTDLPEVIFHFLCILPLSAWPDPIHILHAAETNFFGGNIIKDITQTKVGKQGH